MSKPFYIKFNVSKEIADKAYQLIQVSRDSGKIRKGTNETTKAVERGITKLVLIAEDVDPPQVVAHLPLLCEERKIPYLFVPKMSDLGRSAGLDVKCAAISVLEEGDASDILKELINVAGSLLKGSGKQIEQQDEG